MSEEQKIKAHAEKAHEYKEKRGAVMHIVSDDGEHELWLKKPSRLAVGYFISKRDENIVEACEYLLNDACIQDISDYAYFIKDENFYGIMGALINLFTLKKSISTLL